MNMTKLSLDQLKEQNQAPLWMDQSSLDTISKGYLLPNETPRQMYSRVSKAAAKHTSDPDKYYPKFFDAMWSNFLCPASPVLSNMGTDRGLPISCNSIHVADSIDSIYTKLREFALLSKNGAGVGIYMGDIRGTNEKVSGNGVSSGVIPWIKNFDSATVSVKQGSTRGAASAIYLPIDHPDADEFLDIRRQTGDMNRRSLNVNHGVCISDKWMEEMLAGDSEKRATFTKALKTRKETGEPYFFFTDSVNRQNPDCYKGNNLHVATSNICNEIYLHTDEEHSFVCCLSSLNLVRWDEWKDTDVVETSIRFLDAVLEEYITKGKDKPGLESSIRSAIKGRALGLGVLGYHTLLQTKGLPFDSFDSMLLNNQIFKNIREKAEKATTELAIEFGEPEWCKGYNRRNTHLCVDPKTTLITKDGIVPIIDRVGLETEIWNGNSWTTVTPFKTSDSSKMLKVTLSDGSVLRTTEYHKWMVKPPAKQKSRYKKAVDVETIDLKVGDKLDKWIYPIIEGVAEFPYAYTHGFFCGDGSINQSKPQYDNCKKRKEIRLYDKKKKCIGRLDIKDGCQVRESDEGRCFRFYIPDEVPDKFVVPNSGHTIQSRLDWLSGIIDSDGSCGEYGTVTITASLERKQFLRDIKNMLAITGVYSLLSDTNRNGGFVEGETQYSSLNVSSGELQKLIDIGLKTSRVVIKEVNNKNRIPLTRYVEVLSVEEDGYSDTYCLTDPKNGTAVFNLVKTRQCAIAPTASNSTISGGHSAGIEPIPANIYSQKSAKGTFIRRNPQLEKLLQDRDKDTPEVWKSINENSGSVQHLKFLSENEKAVFLTAREINQFSLVKQAAQRQKYIDQGQSLNLFFASNATAQYIYDVHLEAYKSNLKGLYYFRSEGVLKGDMASRSKEECEACSG